MPETPEPHFAKMIDLEMMMYPGGKERTETEWRELLTANNFRLLLFVPSKAPLGLIEAEAIQARRVFMRTP